MSRSSALAIAVLVLGYLTAGAAGAAQTLSRLEDPPMAPVLELEDMDGRVYRLADYRGQVVIVNFWATWCPPCRREMPSMERAWEQVRDEGIMMLAVNVGEDPDTVFTFTADYPVSFPLLLDQDATVTESWPLRGLPTTYVIDPRGRVVYRAIGGREWDDPALLERIRALASE